MRKGPHHNFTTTFNFPLYVLLISKKWNFTPMEAKSIDTQAAGIPRARSH